MSTPHVSEASKANLEQALHRALLSHLVRDPADTCVISRAASSPESEATGKLVLVTISSFEFRLLVIFHVGEDQVMSSYFARGETSRTVEEAFYEIANMCCGALNRDMNRDFHHLAMSIPYTLSAHCGAYLADLRPDYVVAANVTINDTVRLSLTLCLCCSAAVSFESTELQLEADAGALELF
ncbi:MAG TPA: hypothetical protein VI653_28170 [Steroidobacteraceae bacterium]